MSSSANHTPYQELQNDHVESIFMMAGLYGVYIVLFVLALWCTYREPHRTRTSLILRLIGVMMFALVTAQVIAQLNSDEVSKLLVDVGGQAYDFDDAKRQSAGYALLAAMASPLCGMLSDSLTAWRCWVVWDRPSWLRWALAAIITGTGLIGLVDLGFEASAVSRGMPVTEWRELFAPIWAGCLFLVNGSMTGAILLRIWLASRRQTAMRTSSDRIFTIVRAAIESSLLAWIGVWIYGIIWILPRRSDHDLDSPRFTMMAILPSIFGISQSLMIARIGLSRFPNVQQAISSSSEFLLSMAEGAKYGVLATDDDVERDSLISLHSVRSRSSSVDSEESFAALDPNPLSPMQHQPVLPAVFATAIASHKSEPLFPKHGEADKSILQRRPSEHPTVWSQESATYSPRALPEDIPPVPALPYLLSDYMSDNTRDSNTEGLVRRPSEHPTVWSQESATYESRLRPEDVPPVPPLPNDVDQYYFPSSTKSP